MKKILLFILSAIFSFSINLSENLENEMYAILNYDHRLYKSMYIGDDENNKYYSYNETSTRPLASLTKLMTALIIFDDIQEGKYELNTEVVVSKEASKVPYGVVIKENRIYTIEELLHLLLINSSNSSAYQLALFSSFGNVDEFVDKMNKKAKSLGLRSLRFRTPHGLPPVDTNKAMDIGNARDIYLLALNALNNEKLIEISKKYSYETSDGIKIKSTNTLVQLDEVLGLKTGFHRRAGYNIVYLIDNGDKKIIQVILGANTISSREKLGLKTLELMKESDK
ncbi:D-alanyl-D-alanine carboxypeptidase family protein [Streptobacillus moniliformis]|uniref:Peptidase S11 D-alanyl-D-alanine carboxypeptidase 1 n=1 Tax=Streptobacillus moniliformis (strain ATCC 14647 / DSM 12112 / NCTC 10651 / 9901) TaxID=519441 RepID=D1AX59_STRM9|nr:serine hydrolase [Streptobacillus moniliformis]ACZ00885.1 peptidase S11 D-alanyl-D-alanine carboxypeptidase 1 [Streptobacillus moniliformis DSM 12112]AVL42727.1 D-alanyl-D-alanine carboxypeptidase [Streptobacillus moniliformis]SQA13977.1 D-alanyl-D-alanine carboxypeptidase dacA precursor [Streptobacillus moniliformis]